MSANHTAAVKPGFHGRDIGFAVVIVMMLTILFLPVPTFLIDLGLAFSIAISVLILMVALWISKPLDFSSFPTILLIVTMIRLSLNIATTRVILSNGHEGTDAAGNVIGGFSQFVMGGDFVIGLVVFMILIIVNFMVITKGATRIAEVGARFTLDAIPGKQMSIDADLSAGAIDDAEARARRKELEQESSFFGSMDGASKFVRGDAIAGLIITAVNIFGGIIIGVTRYDMSIGEAADIFTKLSVGDGLVSQIPALVVSLAAGLLVSKGGTTGSAEKAVLDQLGGYPRALFVAGIMLAILGLMPGLPALPFLMLALLMVSVGYIKPIVEERRANEEAKIIENNLIEKQSAERDTVKESLRTVEVELVMGKQLAARMLPKKQEIAHRMKKMRKRFAVEYGFVVPEIQVTDDFSIDPKSYQIKVHGTVVAEYKLHLGDLMVFGTHPQLNNMPKEPIKDPAYGVDALSIPETFSADVRALGLQTADNLSVLLTHLSEVIRNNLPQLLSFTVVKQLVAQMDGDYRKLIDDVCSTHISYPGFQSVLKLLLAERVSIRNLTLISEAIAEIAPSVRKSEAIVEHVRSRISQQLCGDLTENGVLKLLRLGNRWEMAFRESLKRDASGELVQFDIDPRLLEDFSKEADDMIKDLRTKHNQFAIVTSPDARPYVRMIIERLHADMPVISHVEIGKGIEINILGSIS
ncbi:MULTISPECIES: flagellar biosynthesis protein FlhA [Ahrensia]|uniref:Flagellar biosynthesis protein FlhA n=1 Tax=Ahrensia kielensis TaxID=76980 RepID=A0ABU9T9G2_9HYPH|nr:MULTISPECIES: flagellar biosynthesis protein FlhA [Ahrensia]